MDEAAIIKIFQDQFNKGRFRSEDVEEFELDVPAHGGADGSSGNGSGNRSNRTKIITSIDTLVESTDIPPGMGLDLAARKSVVACVSDFAAKGARPLYAVISVNLPRQRATRHTCSMIAAGFKRACDEYGITIMGGDINAGREVVFSVCVFGHAGYGGDTGMGWGHDNGGRIVPRNGARSGDLLFVTGPFGHTAAGLQVLLGGGGGPGGRRAHGSNGFVERAVRAVMEPEARLDFGVQNGGRISSSMDSSDGLAITLNEMARQSHKKFVISSTPYADGLQEYAGSRGLDPDQMVFYGGEEYEFAFTAPPRSAGQIEESAGRLGTPVIQIGRVEAGAGVFVRSGGGGGGGRNRRLVDSGWDHFRPPGTAARRPTGQ